MVYDGVMVYDDDGQGWLMTDDGQGWLMTDDG